MNSTTLFIDGSNFYHSLKEQNKLPFAIEDFSNLFKKIEQQGYRIKKIYFYDAIKDSNKEPSAYSNQQRFLEKLKKLDDRIIIKTRKLVYSKNLTNKKIQETAIELGINEDCRFKLRDFLKKLGVMKFTKEKGVDVQIVIDAIETARKKETDSIILLTGDADFVPAIELIKTYGIETINLHMYKGSSTQLRNTCDKHLLITFNKQNQLLIK